MKMKHDQIGNPYHIDDNSQHKKEVKDEKSLNHVYSVMEQILLELKAIHEHIERLDNKTE